MMDSIFVRNAPICFTILILRFALFMVIAADNTTEVMRGCWMGPGGDPPRGGPLGYDLVAHFAGEPTWYRAKYHGPPGTNQIPVYAGDPNAKYKFFTICGDGCIFDATFMKRQYLRNADGSAVSMAEMCGHMKSKGYNGVMYDFEIFDYTWTEAGNAALNNLFKETKANGMYSAWTTSAMGPYQQTSPQSIPINIQWEYLDFALPEMYDASQNYYKNGLEKYAPWWSKGGKSIHGATLAKPCVPSQGCKTKFLWGASMHSAKADAKIIGPETAKAAMSVTGLPGGFIEWIYACKMVDGGC